MERGEEAVRGRCGREEVGRCGREGLRDSERGREGEREGDVGEREL